MAQLGVSPTDTVGSNASIEINDAEFCQHGLEVCKTCETDFREDNDGTMGFDSAPRGPLVLPEHFKSTKDGSYLCKKHGNGECKSCFGWKKQIKDLQLKEKKASKKTKDSGTNLY